MNISGVELQHKEHSLPPQYHVWGRAGNIQHQVIDQEEAAAVDHAIRMQYPVLMLDDLSLVKAVSVELYQGDQAALNAVFLRYAQNSNIDNGEHVSVLCDPVTFKLLGLTQMRRQKEASQLDPQFAMNKAIQFLAGHAADLVAEPIEVEFDIDVQAGDHVEFTDKPAISNVIFQWVGPHDETIEVEGEAVLVRGQKVKMYIPSLSLWAWVIVGPDGNIITFERNICWDFENQMRLTQMWLHSKWLMAE